MAYTVGRESSKLKRAARRLRKKGYTGEAGKMFAAAEAARINEPTIMTPAFRSEQRAASDLLSYAQTVAADPTFDYEKDIAPLRQAFFGSMASSNLPQDQKEMIANKYTPEFNSIADRSIKDRASFQSIRNADAAFQAQQMQIANAKQQIKKDREVEEMMPEMATKLDSILSDDSKESTTKYMEVTSFITKNPNFFTSKAGASLAKTAQDAIPQTSLMESRQDTVDPYTRIGIDTAFQANSLSGLESIMEGADLSDTQKEGLRQNLKSKRDAFAVSSRNKLLESTIGKDLTAVKSNAVKLTGDAASTISSVALVQRELENISTTLGIRSEALEKFKEAVAVEIQQSEGSASKTGGMSELSTSRASDSLKDLMNAAVQEISNISTKMLSSGFSPSVGSSRRVTNPSMRRSVKQIADIAKINNTETD
tara:strand:+ start:1460 stop:2734 length:1275 start_codon:yes stop_codon:yes gene_type:complete